MGGVTIAVGFMNLTGEFTGVLAAHLQLLRCQCERTSIGHVPSSFDPTADFGIASAIGLQTPVAAALFSGTDDADDVAAAPAIVVCIPGTPVVNRRDVLEKPLLAPRNKGAGTLAKVSAIMVFSIRA
jgi:hypothetical protein